MRTIGESFNVQFVWRLPNNDYLRAVFQARIMEIQHEDDRYVVRLESLVGGMQEAPDGSSRPLPQMDKPRWARVASFVGLAVQVAYEAADQPLYMKLATLDSKHTFFTRLNRQDSG